MDASLRRVLVVDDDAAVREPIAAYLSRQGIPVDTAPNAAAMERALSSGPFGVVLLDVLMPPGEDGLSICRRMAANDGPPVILMSDDADDIDRIVGLELGADDYMAKPCNPREVLARVRAVIRRRWGIVVTQPERSATFAGFRLDLARWRLTDPGGQEVPLPYAEQTLLRALLQRPGRVLTRLQLIEHVLGHGVKVADRAIDIRACRLRQALARHGGEGLVRTIRNQGYVLEAKVEFEGV